MLYQIDTNNPAAAKRWPIQSPDSLGILEKHIEDLFSTHLHELIPENQLMLIGQERQRKEEADVFALDRKGTLYIFELKRWQSCSENLLQVMRYGQIFRRYSYEELQLLAQRHQKLQGNLKDCHKEYFGLEQPLDESKFNADQVFVVVTNGVDQDTLEAINYWSHKGVHINSVTYKLYSIENKPFIYFDVYNPEKEVLLEDRAGVYIVNTNVTYRPDVWRDMLAAPKASAYYSRKYAVADIPKGSTVYLYHTGVGIIAKGRTTASCQQKDYDGDPNEEYYLPLKLDWKLDDRQEWNRAVKAWEINQKLNKGYRFRQTAFGIPKEMGQAIDDLWKEHNTSNV